MSILSVVPSYEDDGSLRGRLRRGSLQRQLSTTKCWAVMMSFSSEERGRGMEATRRCLVSGGCPSWAA